MERFAVALRIRYGQRDGEELLSEGEARAEGELSRAAGGWLLRYKEPDASNESNAVEMALLDGEVRMRRFAGGSARVLSEASYREGVEAPMRYEVDGYSLSLAVYPQTVRWRVDPPFADVRLKYLLKAAGARLLHEVYIEAGSFESLGGCDGWELKAQARAALNGALGARWGFVRRADREDALLVTDAKRAAERLGIDPAPIREGLEGAGWQVKEAEGLWWLDPPEEAFCRALRARRLGGPAKGSGFYAWRDGDLGELQGACAILLRGGPPRWESPGKALLDGPARALIRGAWKHLSGPPARVNRWMREAARRFAVARREGAFAGEYACGVLLERYLWRMGCGLPEPGPDAANLSRPSPAVVLDFPVSP
ncbi:MAG: DUF1934 domain-containing protein [Clostridia bacterium]|nr:DUF1934 domain-containing protein [Clostridia bacterium]